MIIHEPTSNTAGVIEHYSDPNGPTVTYVLTTDLYQPSANVQFTADVFYQNPAHPEFGNHYFGIYQRGTNTYICNADQVEDYMIGMVENDDGDLVYSSNTHDFKMFDNGNMIDGGRDYLRCAGEVQYYKIANGEFYEVRIDG